MKARSVLWAHLTPPASHCPASPTSAATTRCWPTCSLARSTSSVALQFQADMTQSFDTLVKMQSDPKANGLVLTVPQKVVTAG